MKTTRVYQDGDGHEEGLHVPVRRGAAVRDTGSVDCGVHRAEEKGTRSQGGGRRNCGAR